MDSDLRSAAAGSQSGTDLTATHPGAIATCESPGAVPPLARYAPRRAELHWRLTRHTWRWAVLAIGLGILSSGIVVRSARAFGESAARERAATNTAMIVSAYALEAFPRWQASGRARRCPRSLHELDAYVGFGALDAADGWRRPLRARCERGTGWAPTSFCVRSAGADGVFLTADDITRCRVIARRH